VCVRGQGRAERSANWPRTLASTCAGFAVARPAPVCVGNYNSTEAGGAGGMKDKPQSAPGASACRAERGRNAAHRGIGAHGKDPNRRLG
jgi:hypothetical protein